MDDSAAFLQKENIKERIKRGKMHSLARVCVVLTFFLVHLVWGWIFGNPSFLGKELYFLNYLLIAIILHVVASRNSRYTALNIYAIPLIDIPLTFMIVNSWIQGRLPTTKVAAGMLGYAFMIFFVLLSSLFFHNIGTFVTVLSAIAASIVLFKVTGVPPDTQIFAVLLIVVVGFISNLNRIRINQMLASYVNQKSNNEKLTRYFAPSVAKVIQSNINIGSYQATEFDVSVLFTDLREFTRMSAQLSGKQTVDLLNEVHECLVSCVFAAGGTFDKYLGDGLMAYFGAPIEQNNHADLALSCALEMRKAIENLNHERAKRDKEKLTIGIGIHSGPAIIGDIGASIRRDFTAVGDTINTASRIEALTKKYSVDLLFTEATKNLLKEDFNVVYLGEDKLRGKDGVMKTFTLA